MPEHRRGEVDAVLRESGRAATSFLDQFCLADTTPTRTRNTHMSPSTSTASFTINARDQVSLEEMLNGNALSLMQAQDILTEQDSGSLVRAIQDSEILARQLGRYVRTGTTSAGENEPSYTPISRDLEFYVPERAAQREDILHQVGKLSLLAGRCRHAVRRGWGQGALFDVATDLERAAAETIEQMQAMFDLDADGSTPPR